jgi:DNA polymerase III psi subunit
LPKSRVVVVTHSVEGEKNQFLYKILDSIQLADDFNVLLIDKKPVSMDSFLSNKSTEVIIFFGISPEQLTKNALIQTYRIYQFEGKLVTFSDSLGAISTDKTKKKHLWECLKNMRNILNHGAR